MSIRSIRNDEQKIIIIDLYFEDGYFVTLDKIINYDIDLTKRESSVIEITSAFNCSELISRFCNNNDNITKIYFTMNAIDNKNEKCGVVTLCDMYIKNILFNGSVDTVPEMFLRLEGMVK